MKQPLAMGICSLIIGGLFIADGAVMEPVRWLRIAAGISFCIAAGFYFVRARRTADRTPK